MNVTTIDWIQIIVQGGAVGIAILLIVSHSKDIKMFTKTMNDRAEHESKAKIMLTKAITKLSTVVGGCKYNKLNKE